MSLSLKPSCSKLLLLLTLSLVTVYTTTFHPHPHHHATSLSYHKTFLSASSNTTIAAYLRRLTLHPHLSPTLSTALFLHTHFTSLNLTTHLTNFTTLLSYPSHSSLSLHLQNDTVLPLPLSEPANEAVIPPYHAYSPSTSSAIYGPAVFLNYGMVEDYRVLGTTGVQVKGCVGLVRRGKGMSRRDVLDNAAANGVAAVLMYTESEGYKDGVERGTVLRGVGDPLTPGWAGVEGGERFGLDDLRVREKFPSVPSLPVSEKVAESVIRTLEGGRVPKEWRGSFGSGVRIRGVGPGPTMLNFTYEVGVELIVCLWFDY